MKYAREVIDLLETYPARSFRVGELARHATAGRKLTRAERESSRKAVRRVLDVLLASGTAVMSARAQTSGAPAEYSANRPENAAPLWWVHQPTVDGQPGPAP